MLTILIGETDEAKSLHTKALNEFLASAADAAKDGDFYPSFICATALEVQGTLNDDKIAFARALSFLEKVTPSELTDYGAGRLSYEKGRLNWLKGDCARAVEYFTESKKHDPGALPLIYRLDAYVRVNELEKAKHDLATLRSMSVPEDYRLEFLRSAAGLAVNRLLKKACFEKMAFKFLRKIACF